MSTVDRSPKYSLAGYRNKLRTTQAVVLMVEGRDDKRAMVALLREAAGVCVADRADIQIDTATIIEAAGGNRERIEALCASVLGTDVESKVLGLCDREYREFDASIPSADLLTSHRVSGRLVWTRGHSLENYFFCPRVLVGALRASTVATEVDTAIRLFSARHSDFVRAACAVGLTGATLGLTHVVKASLEWLVFNAGAGEPLAVDAWCEVLATKHRLDAARVAAVKSAYASWWEKAQAYDLDTALWLCHGHVGLTALWNAYARCVFEASGRDEAEVHRVLTWQEAGRCAALSEYWASKCRQGEAEYPHVLLDMIRVALDRSRSGEQQIRAGTDAESELQQEGG